MSRIPRTFARALLAALAALTVLGATACGSDSRPAVADWEPRWTEITDGLPPLETLTDDTAHSVCTDTLAMLRTDSPGLAPTPDLAVDDAVSDWVRIAEDAFFECPPRTGEIQSFEQAYTEMAQLEAEVAVALGLDDH